LSRDSSTQAKEHFQGEGYVVVAGLSVSAGASGVVPLAGAIAVRLLADRVGLMTGCRSRFPGVVSRRCRSWQGLGGCGDDADRGR